MLIFLILVVFLNIAFASDDAIADGNVTLADDSSSIAIAEDTSIGEDVLSAESDSSLPSDDLEGMSDEDVVSAYNRPHLHISYRVLNDTVYVDDVFRVEVNFTNDGNMNFGEGVIRFYQTSYGSRMSHVGFQSDFWKLERVNDNYNYDIYVKNNETFNTGDSKVYYLDLKSADPSTHSFYFYVEYVQGREVNTVYEQDRFTILPPNVTMTKKSVNGDVFYVGDEVIYNVTLVNNNYGADGRTWKNLTLIDQFVTGLKLNDCKFYNSNGESVSLDYEFDNYQGMLSVSIPELVDSLTLQLKFKAWADGDLPNKVSLYKTDENSRRIHLFDNETVVHVLPEVKFTKEALAPNVFAGRTVSFKLTVNNTWDRDISNFMISDKLGSYFSYEGYEGDGWIKTGDSNFRYTGTLAPGEVAELVVTVKVAEDYPVNIQSVFGGQNLNKWTNTASLLYDGKVVQDSADVEILPPTLSLNKRSLNESVPLGDNVTFELVISDTFNQKYPYVEVTDEYSYGLEFLSCYAVDGNGEKLNVSYVVNGSKIIFKVNDFDASAIIYTTFKTTQSGWLGNRAAIGRPSNDMSYRFASVYAYTPIYVEKMVDYESDPEYDGYYPGDNITYIVYAYNPNEFNLTNVFVTEFFSENLTFLGIESENWTRTGENTFTYNGNLEPDTGIELYLKFKINKEASGLLLNNVTVGSDETDNVTAICGVELNDIAWDDYEIYLSKYALTPSVKLGETVKFVILVRADGKQESYNVDVVDIMPNGLEFLKCYLLDDEGNEVPLQYSITGSNLTMSLEVNGSAEIYTEFRALEPGYFYNYALLPDNPNNYARAQVYVSSPISVSKSLVDPSGGDNPFIIRPVDYVPEVGSDDLAVFRIFLTNNEDYSITGIVVTDVLPEGFKIVSYEGGDWRQTSDNSFAYRTSLSSHRNAVLTITCKVPSNVTGPYVNKVIVQSNQTENVSASCVFKVAPPSVDITKISLNDTVKVGDNVYFDILVRNIPKYIRPAPIVRMSDEGSGELLGETYEHVEGNYHYYIRHNLEVIDTIPEGLEFESCYALDDFGDRIDIDYRIEGNKVIFTIPTLVKMATIKTTFKAIGQGNQVNTAEVPGNPPSSDKVFVENSNMTVEKLTNNLTVYVGEQVSFTIIVTNTGTTDLYEVFVEDTNYTEGIIYDSYKNNTGSGWKYSNGKFFYQGILKVDESASFDVIFNTTKTGKFNNTVVAGSNSTDNVTATNKTTVISTDSNMTVEKLTNNLTVYVGEQVSFTIIVTNTGGTDLSKVFVEDTNYTAGIVYDSYANRTGSGWKYSNGKFFYQGILKVGESASFDVIFNTTKTGLFNNTVVAGSNSTDNVTATNKTTVIANVTDDSDDNKTSGGKDKDLEDDEVTNPKKPTGGSDEEETTTDPTKPTGSNAEVSSEDDPSTGSASDDEMEVGVNEGKKSVTKSSAISNELTTGNPILALLMVLISIVGVVRYSKK